MTDQHDLCRPNLSHDRRDIFAESARAPAGASAPRVAVPCQIEADDAVARRKDGDLGVPIMSVAAPAVHENDGGRAALIQIEANWNAVVGDGDIGLSGHCRIIRAVWCTENDWMLGVDPRALAGVSEPGLRSRVG